MSEQALYWRMEAERRLRPERGPSIDDPHQPEECQGNYWHCFSHQLDETPPPGVEPFRSCFECKHMFLTEYDLVWAFNWEMDESDRLAREGGWDTIERVPVMSADEIFFCPFCTHDF